MFVYERVWDVACSMSHKHTRDGLEPFGRNIVDLVVSTPLPNNKLAGLEFKFLKNREDMLDPCRTMGCPKPPPRCRERGLPVYAKQ